MDCGWSLRLGPQCLASTPKPQSASLGPQASVREPKPKIKVAASSPQLIMLAVFPTKTLHAHNQPEAAAQQGKAKARAAAKQGIGERAAGLKNARLLLGQGTQAEPAAR
ncbi:hypothetical protein E4U41_007443 [Claviceps citrina]|nr:hypothetical protein E4U41_007443 [Claviceps citrina]